MLRQIPHSSLMQQPELTGSKVECSTMRPYLFACSFYGITPITTPIKSPPSFAVPFASVFENLVSLSGICAEVLIQNSSNLVTLREVYSHSLLLIDRLVGRLGTSVQTSWEPTGWLRAVLHAVEHEVTGPSALSSDFGLLTFLIVCQFHDSRSDCFTSGCTTPNQWLGTSAVDR
jgi:hypothetical protein